MSKNTFFNTRFWQDTYIADLDPSEKLLFNYCITSPFLSLCGIYEVPLKFIATETGMDREMISKMLTRFEKDKKIAYKDGWLCVLNYPKYQSYNLPNVKKGLEKEIKSIPEDILFFFTELGYEYELIANVLAIDWQGIDNLVREREQGKGTRNKDKEEKTQKIKKEKYGEFQNVLLLPNEYVKLTEQFGEQPTQALIEELSGYLESSGKRYKSHYATLLNWARRKINEHHQKINKNNKVAF